MFELLQNALDLLTAKLPLLLVVAVICASVWLFFSARKKIIFEAWVNRFDQERPDIGKSAAELLLFKLRSIKLIHEKSVEKLSLWNPYQDIPAFRQGLDEDIKLLASIELGKYGQLASGILTFFFRLLPIMLQPSTVKGSINRYGNEMLILVSLENYSPRRKAPEIPRLWEMRRSDASRDSIPEMIEELAYRIYLDLTGEELFKSWRSFREYSIGLSHYLRYTDLSREVDFREAETHYIEALKLEPNNPAVCYNLGVLKYYRWKQKDNDEAIDYFSKALNSSSLKLKARAHSGISNALSQSYHRFHSAGIEALQNAIFHGKQAIDVNAKLDSANKCLGFAHHQLSEAHARSSNPDKDRSVSQNRKEALKYYQRTCKINPKHYIVYNNLGNLYLEWSKTIGNGQKKKKILKKALAACEKSLGINPAYIHAHDNIGNAYYEMQKYAKAKEAYLSALMYNPEYPEAKNDLAMVHLKLEPSEENIALAFKYHLQALRHAGQSESQKKKLKRQYAEKLEEFLDSDASPELKDLVCRKQEEIDRDLQRSEVR